MSEQQESSAGVSQNTEKRVFEIQKKSKVAIIGCADSKNLAPFDNAAEWEFWGVNNLFLTLPKVPWTRWFELHCFNLDQNTGQYSRRGKPEFRGQRIEQYLTGLNNLKIPVYMQRPFPIIPNAVPYPVKEVLQSFGNYFTNTISWQIALAIMEGFKTIGIYGVDMAVSSPLRHQNEYSHQRPSCEYFIGLARGRGIEVIIPPTSDLLKTNFLYCFQEPEENAFILKMDEMERSMAQRQAEVENKRAQSEAKMHQYIGARSAIQEIKKIRFNDYAG